MSNFVYWELFYNIEPSISVCDKYISPYLFATCIQYNSAILFLSRLLACKYRLTRNLSRSYQTLRKKYGIENALLFRFISKGNPFKLSANITLLFYKEIYMEYLILYYNDKYHSSKDSACTLKLEQRLLHLIQYSSKKPY
jgi:hypothetical protein